MNILNKAIAAMPSLESVTPSLNTVLNAANTILPVARVGCYGAAAFLAGRKVLQGAAGAGYQVASMIVKDNAGLKAKSESFYTAAKQNLVRDLTIATGLVAAGYGIEKAENYVAQALDNQNGVLNQTATFFKGIWSYAKADDVKLSTFAQKTKIVFDNTGFPGTKVANGITDAAKTLVNGLNSVRFTAPFEGPSFAAKVINVLDKTELPSSAEVVRNIFKATPGAVMNVAKATSQLKNTIAGNVTRMVVNSGITRAIMDTILQPKLVKFV